MKLLILLLFLCPQDLTVTTTESTSESVKTTTVTESSIIGQYQTQTVLSETTSSSIQKPIVILNITSSAPKVRVKSHTASVITLGLNEYAVTTPGTHIVEILALGIVEGELLFEEAELTVTVGKPEPPPPPPPLVNPFPVGSVSAQIYDVIPPNKQDECLVFSAAFRSVASKAAGLAPMTAQDMITETSLYVKANLTSDQRASWNVWQDAYKQIYSAQNMGTDKGRHITFWNDVANAFDASITKVSKLFPPLLGYESCLNCLVGLPPN